MEQKKRRSRNGEEKQQTKKPIHGFEAEEMSDVVSAPKKQIEGNTRDLDVPTWHATARCKDNSLRPCNMWVKDLLKDFTEVRDSFFSKVRDSNERNDLPKRDDENAWYLFCFEGEGHAPLLSIVSSMDTLTRETVLSYHVNWLDDKSDYILDAQFAVWIYALLVGIEKPLSPSVASDIRRLLVTCSRMRSECSAGKKNKKELEKSLACLNIMITLAGTYFGQEETDRRLMT